MFQCKVHGTLIIQCKMALVGALRRYTLIQQQNAARFHRIYRSITAFILHRLMHQYSVQAILLHVSMQLLFCQCSVYRDRDPLIPTGHPHIGTAATYRQQPPVNDKTHTAALGRCRFLSSVATAQRFIAQLIYRSHYPFCNFRAHIPCPVKNMGDRGGRNAAGLRNVIYCRHISPLKCCFLSWQPKLPPYVFSLFQVTAFAAPFSAAHTFSGILSHQRQYTQRCPIYRPPAQRSTD